MMEEMIEASRGEHIPIPARGPCHVLLLPWGGGESRERVDYRDQGTGKRGESSNERSTERILTTHPGKLPNPDVYSEVVQARKTEDWQTFDALVPAGIADMVRKQQELGIDILSDGEFWKARDQQYYDSRASGIETRRLRPGEPGLALGPAE